ncbi:MAG: hypothetical protein NW207_05040 [Cytophagales bacterium]|nr:hypothetical protein [Cytophagales bacterium]
MVKNLLFSVLIFFIIQVSEAQQSVIKTFEIIELNTQKSDTISTFKGKVYINTDKIDTTWSNINALLTKQLVKKHGINAIFININKEVEYFYRFSGTYINRKKEKKIKDSSEIRTNKFLKIIYFRKKLVSENQIKFPTDENGKINFSGTIPLDSAQNIYAWANLSAWIKTLLTDKKEDKITFSNQLMGQMEVSSSFKVYITSIFSKIPHGIVKYNVYIEAKNRQVIYSFTDFNFYYYIQNRNMRYEKTTHKSKPLEDTKFPGFQQSWNGHRYETMTRVKNQTSSLKRFLQNVPLK